MNHKESKRSKLVIKNNSLNYNGTKKKKNMKNMLGGDRKVHRCFLLKF